MTKAIKNKKPGVSIFVAMSENRVIGRDGDLPWHLPADLKRFRALTTGHTIIMGRRTWQSIGRPLPQRRSIVLTGRSDFRPQSADVACSLDEALTLAAGDEEVFVIGGAALYRAALPSAERLYLTMIHAQVEGDVRFPEVDLESWQLVEDERHEADDRHLYPYSFRRYDRCRPA
jgi:dihydrofolate reductase